MIKRPFPFEAWRASEMHGAVKVEVLSEKFFNQYRDHDDYHEPRYYEVSDPTGYGSTESESRLFENEQQALHESLRITEDFIVSIARLIENYSQKKNRYLNRLIDIKSSVKAEENKDG